VIKENCKEMRDIGNQHMYLEISLERGRYESTRLEPRKDQEEENCNICGEITITTIVGNGSA
jgi:hypothetical protein